MAKPVSDSHSDMPEEHILVGKENLTFPEGGYFEDNFGLMFMIFLIIDITSETYQPTADEADESELLGKAIQAYKKAKQAFEKQNEINKEKR